LPSAQRESTHPNRLLDRCKGATHSSRVSVARADQHQADAWQALPDGWRYLNSQRWQAPINGRPQLRTRLIDQRRVVITNKNGKADDSDSAQVAVVVQNLITARPNERAEHFPEREIRAAMLALKPQLRPGVSLEQYMVDVDYLINLYRPNDYTPRATRYLAPIVKRPVGRPTHAPEVNRFFLFLQERITSDTPVSRKALADEYGVHMRTVATYLDDLRRAGRVSWVRKSHGLAITFTSSDVIEIISAPAVTQPIAAPEIEQDTPYYGETGYQKEECVSPDRATADHISQAANSGESTPTLAELAKHYLDQPARDIGEEYVITTTGLISYRRTAKHFASLVTAEYSYTETQALEAYKTEQERRELVARQAWAVFFAQLKAMTNDELIAYVVDGCRRDVAELSRGGGAFDKHMYQTRLRCAKQHLGWRGLKLPKRATRIRTARPGDAWLPDEVPVVIQLLPLESLPDSLPSVPSVLPLIERTHAAKADREAAYVE
jgi:hypothetical protein